MASIRKEFLIDALPETVWAALRDIGALHLRLVPGFVVDCRLEGDARIVTFANGMVAREIIVDLDDNAHRPVWSATGGELRHYNASMQIFAQGPYRTRAVWIADLLPHELAAPNGAMIEQGAQAMKQKLERDASSLHS
jgi:carbon monoxide dehydrogenase subunit G